jgi:hypothetical protein
MLNVLIQNGKRSSRHIASALRQIAQTIIVNPFRYFSTVHKSVKSITLICRPENDLPHSADLLNKACGASLKLLFENNQTPR